MAATRATDAGRENKLMHCIVGRAALVQRTAASTH